MLCWAFLQVHPETGEVHVAFTTNPLEDPSDILILSGGWENAEVHKEKVYIVASEKLCKIIGNTSLRTEVSFPVTDAELNSPENSHIRELLKRHFKKEIETNVHEEDR